MNHNTKLIQIKVQKDIDNVPVYINSVLKSDFSLDIPNSTIEEMIKNGSISIRSKEKLTTQSNLKKGILLTVTLKKKDLKNYSLKVIPEFTLSSEEIVFEDSSLIVVNKPSGLSTNATLDSSKDHLFAATIRYISKGHKEKYLAAHHRIDQETSGIVLFCKKKSLNKNISDLFEKRQITKTYLAVVSDPKGTLKDNFSVINFLDRKADNKMKVQSVSTGGKKAHSIFKVLKRENDLVLVQIQPKSGRMHQIRVHLSELGCPIVGDSIYGGLEGKRTLLHAWKLEFIHPKTNDVLKLLAPEPSDFPLTT